MKIRSLLNDVKIDQATVERSKAVVEESIDRHLKLMSRTIQTHLVNLAALFPQVQFEFQHNLEGDSVRCIPSFYNSKYLRELEETLFIDKRKPTDDQSYAIAVSDMIEEFVDHAEKTYGRTLPKFNTAEVTG